MLTAGLCFIIVVFLPAFIEMLKPRRREPRRILKAPFQKTIRHVYKSNATSGSNSAVNGNASSNMENLLKKNGVKYQRIDLNTLRIFGNIVLPQAFEILENIVVLGKLTVGDKCVLHGTAKAKKNVLIGSQVVIKGNMISEGDIEIGDDSVIAGLVHSQGSVKLGEKVFVGLSVVANGDVELYEDSEVKKNILTHGIIKVLKRSRLDLPATLDDLG